MISNSVAFHPKSTSYLTTHPDLATPNAFLRPSTDGGLPNVIIADFGYSLHEIERNPNTVQRANPHEYVLDNHGTNNYAPEYARIQRTSGGALKTIGEKADVWAIGSILFKLMSNVHPDDPMRDVEDGEGTLDNCFVAARDHGRMGQPGDDLPFGGYYPPILRYSIELQTLMAKCLNWEPDHRPSLRELKIAIDGYLGSHPNVRNDTSIELLKMSAPEDGLKIGDPFAAKRRKVD
jgi:serine/threonine protein kinase